MDPCIPFPRGEEWSRIARSRLFGCYGFRNGVLLSSIDISGVQRGRGKANLRFVCPSCPDICLFFPLREILTPNLCDLSQLALTAASPLWRGYIADVDARWNVVSASVDDRTEEERGLKVRSESDDVSRC